MRFLSLLTLVFEILSVSTENTCINPEINSTNGCISFSVGQGTGCAWMCEYCQTNLGTTNYYFTDGVCTYNSGGCAGNPIAGKQYTCCSL
jgi:hypothetical protein